MKKPENETGAIPPEHRVDPKWAEAFTAQLAHQFGALLAGGHRPAVAERDETIDTARLCDQALGALCDRSVGCDFAAKDGSLWHCLSWHPEYTGFAVGGMGGFYAKLNVQKFEWSNNRNQNGELLRKPIADKFTDARDFFKSHRRLAESEHPDNAAALASLAELQHKTE